MFIYMHKQVKLLIATPKETTVLNIVKAKISIIIYDIKLYLHKV